MNQACIHDLGTPIAPAERADRRRQMQLRLTCAALVLAIVTGSAWGLHAMAQAERKHAAEVPRG